MALVKHNFESWAEKWLSTWPTTAFENPRRRTSSRGATLWSLDFYKFRNPSETEIWSANLGKFDITICQECQYVSGLEYCFWDVILEMVFGISKKTQNY